MVTCLFFMPNQGHATCSLASRHIDAVAADAVGRAEQRDDLGAHRRLIPAPADHADSSDLGRHAHQKDALLARTAAHRDVLLAGLFKPGTILSQLAVGRVQIGKATLEAERYVNLSRTANAFAQQIKQKFVEHGCKLFSDTIANQVFIILPNAICDKLSDKYCFTVWEKLSSDMTAVRFVTNVTTKKEDVDALLADIDKAFA